MLGNNHFTFRGGEGAGVCFVFFLFLSPKLIDMKYAEKINRLILQFTRNSGKILKKYRFFMSNRK
jgi:hypothetical protein